VFFLLFPQRATLQSFSPVEGKMQKNYVGDVSVEGKGDFIMNILYRKFS